MRFCEVQWRWRVFWDTFALWVREVIEARGRYGVSLLYTVYVDDIPTYYYNGTIWGFAKWLLTHKPF